MFEEQAFLLRDELHLYGVLAQQVGQGQRHEKRVLLSWLYSQGLHFLWVSQLGFREFCLKKKKKSLQFFFLPLNILYVSGQEERTKCECLERIASSDKGHIHLQYCSQSERHWLWKKWRQDKKSTFGHLQASSYACHVSSKSLTPHQTLFFFHSEVNKTKQTQLVVLAW